MRRIQKTLFAAVLVACALPAGASAKITEVGVTAATNPPSCPASPCLAISKTTGFQTQVGTQRSVFIAPRDGRLVAFTVTLGKPSGEQTTFFNDRLGGKASARIAVLKPGKAHLHRVSGLSEVADLTPYFGQTVQFPLARSLFVKKGYIIALSVPTWAPTLAVGLDNQHGWRASRKKDACEDTSVQSAQTKRKQFGRYACLYRTARLTYSATLISTP